VICICYLNSEKNTVLSEGVVVVGAVETGPVALLGFAFGLLSGSGMGVAVIKHNMEDYN
jgi:hypothetical protein